MGFVLFAVVREDYPYGALPFSRGFQWPQVTAHDTLAQSFVDMIPASASVSAQSSLVPHLSERATVYLFPYGDEIADYIFLDITSVTYPFESNQYLSEVKKVVLNGNYGVVEDRRELAAQKKVFLLLASRHILPYRMVMKWYLICQMVFARLCACHTSKYPMLYESISHPTPASVQI